MPQGRHDGRQEGQPVSQQGEGCRYPGCCLQWDSGPVELTGCKPCQPCSLAAQLTLRWIPAPTHIHRWTFRIRRRTAYSGRPCCSLAGEACMQTCNLLTVLKVDELCNHHTAHTLLHNYTQAAWAHRPHK
jgi:hypothetical protein